MTEEQKRFVRIAHQMACFDWKLKIQEHFPNVIEKQSKVVDNRIYITIV